MTLFARPSQKWASSVHFAIQTAVLWCESMHNNWWIVTIKRDKEEREARFPWTELTSYPQNCRAPRPQHLPETCLSNPPTLIPTHESLIIFLSKMPHIKCPISNSSPSSLLWYGTSIPGTGIRGLECVTCWGSAGQGSDLIIQPAINRAVSWRWIQFKS
jgi:hypothetical protein